MDDGLLYEGTGRYGQSRLLKTELETGKVLRQYDLDPEYFGEGVTVFGDDVFQLTYLSNTGFIYDKESFEPVGAFEYPTQGWGLTNDGKELIMSDGSAALRFLDLETLQETRRITTSDNEGVVENLNELEYIDGEVYANVFKTTLIAIIDPETGEVTGWINLAGINPDPAELKDPYFLNGIAYRQETGHLLVTGKGWPTIFEIELVPQ
jgi:glutamine cyclotransferase